MICKILGHKLKPFKGTEKLYCERCGIIPIVLIQDCKLTDLKVEIEK